MKVAHHLLAWALIAYAEAQTPTNFSVVSTAPLEVIGQPGNITLTPGLLVPQSGKSSPVSNTLPVKLLTTDKMFSTCPQSSFPKVHRTVLTPPS